MKLIFIQNSGNTVMKYTVLLNKRFNCGTVMQNINRFISNIFPCLLDEHLNIASTTESRSTGLLISNFVSALFHLYEDYKPYVEPGKPKYLVIVSSKSPSFVKQSSYSSYMMKICAKASHSRNIGAEQALCYAETHKKGPYVIFSL